jgi:DNA polymerase
LDGALESVGFERRGVFITNVVKCRPPGNRRPRADEVAECAVFLDEQLGVLEPRVVAPMGNSALRYFFGRFGLGRAAIGEVHGEGFTVGFPWGEGLLFPLYHPAAVLYNRGLGEVLEEDLGAMVSLLSLGV